MTTAQWAIVACLLWPLMVSALVAVFGNKPNVRDTVMIAVASGLLPIVIWLTAHVHGGGTAEWTVLEMFPGLPIAFSVEPLGLVYALVASSLWPITSLYAVGYLRGHHEHNQTRFFIFFSAAISAAMAIAFAANLLTLFVFYEVLTLSTYPLVTHHQDEEARTAGRIYLGILLTTSVGLLLPAIAATYVLTGSMTFVQGGFLAGHIDEGWPLMVLLGLYAFGIGKAGLMPFHRWLPNAMVAPTPVSALLHAVAVVKAGVFSILKVVIYVFGLDLLSSTGASVWLMYAAAFTIVTGSLVAMTKDNLKERLAYSTISQLAYIVLGAALATPDGVMGGSLHIAMHAFGKITLFFCAGAIYVATHKKKISQMVGLGRQMPFTYAAFTFGALSIIGVPPGGGSWSKWYLGMGAVGAEHPLLVGVLMLSSLLNIAYLMPIVAQGFFLEPPEATVEAGYDERHWMTIVPPVATAVGTVVLFFTAGGLYELLLPIVS